MCKSEYPYEDGAIYLVRELKGGETELAQWNGEFRTFRLFGDSDPLIPELFHQVIARIEYSLRPI